MTCWAEGGKVAPGVAYDLWLPQRMMLSVSYEFYTVVSCLSACCIRGMQSWVVGVTSDTGLSLGFHCVKCSTSITLACGLCDVELMGYLGGMLSVAILHCSGRGRALPVAPYVSTRHRPCIYIQMSSDTTTDTMFLGRWLCRVLQFDDIPPQLPHPVCYACKDLPPCGLVAQDRDQRCSHDWPTHY